MKWCLSLLALGWLLPSLARAQFPVSVTVEARAPGYALPADYTGLGFETLTLLPDRQGGHFFSATNAPLITLFQNLALKNLRVGGATVDRPKVNIPTTEDIDHLFAFARAAGVRVIYSLRLMETHKAQDFSAADARLARHIWQHHRAQLDCFAVGNEPDWNSFHTADPQVTNYTSYLHEWRSFAQAITKAAPGATFAGPDTGDNRLHGAANSGPGPAWSSSFAQDEAGLGRVRLITQHHYVGEDPGTLSARQGIDCMLSPSWNTVSNQTLYSEMAVPVRACGLAYRLTEANEFTGGLTNASNTFAAALWALDFLHWWAAHGATGVNFHNKRWIPNDTITLAANGQLSLNPKGYALRAFDLGGHGYSERVTTTNSHGLNLTAYAVGDTNEVFVTLINKEHGLGARDASVTIVVQGFLPTAGAVIALSAPGRDVAATNGITLGGASISNNAPWTGAWTSLNPSRNGSCSITVAAASASVVHLRASRPLVSLR